MRALLVAAVLLTGCDDAPAAPVGEAPASVDPERVEAEKACSAITGYRQGSSDELRAREYAACVAVVLEDEPATEDGPALRGRMDAPV